MLESTSSGQIAAMALAASSRADNSERLSRSAFSTPVLEAVEADEGTAEGEKGLMGVGAALIADGEPPKSIEPGKRAFHDPAMATQPLAGVATLAGNPQAYAVPGERFAAAWDVVGLVGVELAWPRAVLPRRRLIGGMATSSSPKRRKS